ncbi:MFS transporter [Pseudoclavibacter caeni]|uniref:MFS transporter n=1 Tax=Pseudoclavibacter caeni TaxID=908846 RepID=UPI0017A6233C|nr:MFS transporter [Pseudoclavibacter caeni]NYJ97218.1 MFS family permease [Pseudoclavibacter caeni]
MTSPNISQPRAAGSPNANARRPEPAPDRRLFTRLAVASGAGTALEYYDFALYATATSIVFNQVFFVVDDPWFGAFLGFVTFAVGFLMAPVGAVVFGHLGDRIGRRRTLVATFTLMGVATVLMGLLPDYHTIGVTAPVLLLILRLAHGIARGGEVGGAGLLSIEQAPTGRRGIYGSFVTLGSPIGAGLANLMVLAILAFPADVVVAGLWRVPFLLGGLVLIIGLITRLHVDETPVFQRLQDTETVSPHPLADAVRANGGRILTAAGVVFGFNAFQFVLFSFLLSYGSEAVDDHGLGLSRSMLIVGTLLGCLAHAAAILVGSMISDRVGRRPVIATGAIALAAYAIPMFPLFRAGGTGTSADPAGALAAMVIGFTLSGIMFGPVVTWFAQLFPAARRYTAVGLAFQLGAAFGGGFSPLIANRLLAATGSTLSISLYLIVVMVLSLVCVALLPERAAEVDDLR